MRVIMNNDTAMSQMLMYSSVRYLTRDRSHRLKMVLTDVVDPHTVDFARIKN